MTKRKLDKTDIGEMYHWASSAFHSGFLKVEIDSDHVIELCERALDNSRLAEENAKLREALERLVNPDNCKKDIIHIIGNAESTLNQPKDQNNDK